MLDDAKLGHPASIVRTSAVLLTAPTRLSGE
jgi:hypothetical protein